MNNILNDCGCLCVNPERVNVTSATVAGTLATLTVDRELTGLNIFRLFIPCAIIDDIADTDTVSFTDGTNTYAGANWLGNNLRVGTLDKVFCRNRRGCNCNECLVCSVENDTVGAAGTAHVQVWNRII